MQEVGLAAIYHLNTSFSKLSTSSYILCPIWGELL